MCCIIKVKNWCCTSELMQVTAKWTCSLTTSAVLNELSDSVLTISLQTPLQEKFMSKLNRDDIRLSLERIGDRHTMEVQTLDTEAHGQLIQETERNEPAEQNKVKDTALIATKKRLKRQEAIRKMVGLNFVVATTIASVTYAAVIQVPGGNDDDDGEATLRENKYFKIFMIFNACAFVFSLLSMLFHFCIGHVSLSSSIGLIYASLCFTFTQFSLLGITGAFFFVHTCSLNEKLGV